MARASCAGENWNHAADGEGVADLADVAEKLGAEEATQCG